MIWVHINNQLPEGDVDMPNAKKEPEFAIRCFKNGKRKYTARLTVGEAWNLRIAAKHLAEFLTKTYKLPGS